MIRIRAIEAGVFYRHETIEEAVNRFMSYNKISDIDVINLVPDRDNPTSTVHIYYKERDF